MFDKLVDFLLSILHWFRFWCVCGAEFGGFVRRFGLPVRDLKPGLNFLLPFGIETATLSDLRTWADVLPAQSLRTRDGVDLVVQLMVSHYVADPRAFELNVYDANNNIQDVAAGELGAAVMAAHSDAVYNGEVLKKVRKKVVAAAKDWGLSVVNVRFTDCVRAPAYRIFGASFPGHHGHQ